MNSDKIQGYIFATRENLEFANTKIGDTIVKAEKIPPCFVVDHFHLFTICAINGLELWREMKP